DGIEIGFSRGEAKGRNEGRAEGENKLGALIDSLINAGRNDEIQKVTSDAEYRQKLYEEFGIK
ncbi:MAG: hypothetical protein ACI4KB_10250, partial [Oscillospiraceae bacterium]